MSNPAIYPMTVHKYSRAESDPLELRSLKGISRLEVWQPSSFDSSDTSKLDDFSKRFNARTRGSLLGFSLRALVACGDQMEQISMSAPILNSPDSMRLGKVNYQNC